MAFKEQVYSLLQSGAAMTAAGSILATGSYVVYKDRMRYPRMMRTYSTGNILAPMAQNQYEVAYFKRPDVEAKFSHVMCSHLSNEYYLVNGEVGSGKTRSIVEIVRSMMRDSGAKNEGAPVYLLATQGKSFPETLASAVNFLFDEHISFKFFLDFVLRIHSFPGKDDHHRLTRVLDAIEKSAFQYLQTHGRPVILVIDGVDALKVTMPGALEKLQEKAKLWADTNIVKIIFVSNEEDTEILFQGKPSNWSRAATPVHIGDLSREQAVSFLVNPQYMEFSESDQIRAPMDEEHAEQIYHLVGGRMNHLIAFKRDWVRGIPYKETVVELESKEREKFLNVCRRPSAWKVIQMLKTAPNRCLPLSRIIRETSEDDLYATLKQNVVTLERKGTGIVCKFESKLTQNVVDQFYK